MRRDALLVLSLPNTGALEKWDNGSDPESYNASRDVPRTNTMDSMKGDTIRFRSNWNVATG